jgi:hypothetical protein
MSVSFQETGNVRQWLELQIGDTELGVIKEAVQEEIKKLKGNENLSDFEVLTLQEEEMKRRCKEFVKYCYGSDDCVGMLCIAVKIELDTSTIVVIVTHWRTEGWGLGGSNPPRNSEILTKYQKLRKFYYMK